MCDLGISCNQQLKMAVNLLETSRGGNKLLVDGFVYRLKDRRANCIRWKCEERGCLAALKTNLAMGNPAAVQGRVHSHGPPEETVVQARQLRAAMTRQVVAAPHVSAGQVVVGFWFYVQYCANYPL
jgi:hypothetical protein